MSLDTKLLQLLHTTESNVRPGKKRTLMESHKPQTGIYWWAPVKNGWRLATFADDEFGGKELLHQDIWYKYCAEILDIRSEVAKVPKPLRYAYSGLPRGRVNKRPSDGRWLILHGDDAPVDDAIKLIAFKFNLPAGKYIELFDDHETILPDDLQTIQSYTGKKLGLKINCPDFGDDDDIDIDPYL